MRQAADLDLNLLRTFVAIYEAGSLTRAAGDLHVSQPAVSHALARLRAALGDELFTRAPGGVRPTVVAKELFALVRGPLRALHDGLSEGLRFDPAASTRTFTLAMTDLGASGLLPRVVAAVAKTAPGVSFEVHPVDVASLAVSLETGAVDAAVASETIAGHIESEPLFRDRYACLVRQDFAAAGPRIDEATFFGTRHARVADDMGHSHVERALAARGGDIGASVTVRSFASLPSFVAECGLIAVVPFDGFAPYMTDSLRLLELPFELPHTDVRLHWHEGAASSPARAWLLETLRDVLRREGTDGGDVAGAADAADAARAPRASGFRERG